MLVNVFRGVLTMSICDTSYAYLFPFCSPRGNPLERAGVFSGEFAEILESALANREINFGDICRAASFLEKDQQLDCAEAAYKVLPEAAKIYGDVSPIMLSSAMIDYARMLDKQKGREIDADMISNLALLNLHGR
jgi:hypothetical protein